MNGFAFAGPGDSAGILKIMEEDITPGGLQLLYTRRDDPYASFLAESPEAKIGVVYSDGRVVATIAAIPRRMYINGRITKVCYVSNMKRLKDCSVNINWYKMFDETCKAVDCEIYFCSLLSDNEAVQKMLHKKRRYMPWSEVMCKYKTYILSPKVRDPVFLKMQKGPDKDKGIQLMRGSSSDETEIVRYLNAVGRGRNLFPVFDTLSDIGDLRPEDFCLVKRDGRIAAAGALWDRSKVKQYVVKGCHGIYAFLRFLNPILPWLGYIQIPEDDEIAPVAFISFLLADNDDEYLYRCLLNYICTNARGRYSMLVTGNDGNNAKRPILDSLKSVSFETQFNEITMTNMDGKVPKEHDWKCIEAECALL